MSRRTRRASLLTTSLCLVAPMSVPAAAQVDEQRAATYFKEAAALCEREGGRLWGVSLCGPIAAKTQPAENAEAAAKRYGGPDLRVAEEKRDAEQKIRIAELRRRFVDGPVVVVPRGRNASFSSTGMTPIPGAGTIYPSYRVTGEWGSLEASSVLRSADGNTLTLPGPARVEGTTVSGDGWTVNLAAGWVVRPGPRAGDFQVVRESR